MRLASLALLTVVVLSACARVDEPVAPASPEDQVREAVFHYLFEHQQLKPQGTLEAYFLGLGAKGDDPPPHFMRRFAGHRPPVKPLSASSLDTQEMRLLDPETGGVGLYFEIHSVDWRGEDQAHVQGGCYLYPVTDRRSEYRVTRDSGGWVVTPTGAHVVVCP